MTPAARLSAAIEILDDWLAGQAPEQVLTRWARANRYAGSKDRAAIRDLVYDAVRCRRSFAYLGGSETGRGLVLGGCRARGEQTSELFSGARFAPEPLSHAERVEPDLMAAPEGTRLDLPDWILPHFRKALAGDFEAVAALLQTRAPVFLRVNPARCPREAAQGALADEGIETRPHSLSPWALEVTAGARRVHLSKPYTDGRIEVQDAASQALVAELGALKG